MPRTQIYSDYEVVYDLLNFSAKHLKLNGRLVYLLPCTNKFNEKKDLPRHECFELIGNSEQMCQGIFRRRLITMIKINEFKENMKPIINKDCDWINLKDKIIVPNQNKKKQPKQKRNINDSSLKENKRFKITKENNEEKTKE